MLEANAGNVLKTVGELAAAGMDVPYSTLMDWAKDRGVNSYVAELRDIKKGQLHEKLQGYAHRVLDHLMEQPIEGSAPALMTGLGIAIDKMQLLQGKATSISENITREERIHRIAELLERQRASGDGIPSSGDKRTA